jgi:hypothetical protein
MKPLVASVLVGLMFAACGGKVTIADEDAATDTAPTSTDAPAPTPTMTTTPPECPKFRPVRGVPCRTGLSCFYPCGGGFPMSIRATCPAGTWETENVAACD